MFCFLQVFKERGYFSSLVIGVRLLGYVRTSSEERDGGGQEFAIYKWAGEEGHQVVEVFRDIGVSGVTPLDARPGWVRLMERLSEVDGIIVESLDRISRDPGQLRKVIDELRGMGKVILSVREDWATLLFRNNDPVSQLLLNVVSWFVEQERKAASERTREKLAKLKAEGKKLGRPPKWNNGIKQQLVQLVERGLTLKEACRIIGVNYGTAIRYLSNDPDYLKAKYTARLGRLIGMRKIDKTSLTTGTLKTNNVEDLN
jgi:putative DNA-invertase from lambdoid prophage Rac